ncbi:penicillin-binding protein 2, partial [bacterium]|nr:penicillin-binding protein 2 [bacterium]
MSFLGQEQQVREYQDRFKYLSAALAVAFSLLLLQLLNLQVLQGDSLRMASEENRIKRVKIPAPRGMIFDRTGRLLLDNRPAFDLEVIPQYLKESKRTEETIATISKITKMSPDEIQKILNRAKGQPAYLPIKIKTDLTRDEVAELKSWQIAMPGVSVEMEIKRTNVYGDLASHMLGYIGEVNATEMPLLQKNSARRYKLGDSIGKFGLEQKMEQILRGDDGEEWVEVDALGRRKLEKYRGRFIAESQGKKAVPGKNLTLTVDQDLQKAAADAFGDKVGSVVAIDPNTGEILAMLSRPSFDPTEFSRGIPAALWQKLLANENKPLRDKTIMDHYSPGSVFKTITAVAGLQEKVIDENTKFHCSGSLRLGNRVYHCWKKEGHGEVDVITALTKSCDVFFYRLAQKLKSVDDIATWALHLGLGRKTDINLPRETSGLIPTEAWKRKRFGQEWTAGETLSVAIGQGYVLTTALQLANTYASIANGGTFYRPFLIKKITTVDGELEKEYQPEVLDETRLDSKTYDLIKKGLWGVVNHPNGTAFAQRLPGMDFVGKTGTVQVISLAANKIYQKCENMKFRQRHHGMFAGFAPINNPKIAVAVVAEHACHGSSGAAPIARAVIKAYLEKYYPDQFGTKALSEKGVNPIKALPIMEGEDE